MPTRAEIGRAAEERAAAYLEGRGYRILARNFRAQGGEIDLVAERDGVLCFVEVRRRGAGARVGALASVDSRKRARLSAAARAFVARHSLAGRPARFDVVALEGEGAITHIPSAFPESGSY